MPAPAQGAATVRDPNEDGYEEFEEDPRRGGQEPAPGAGEAGEGDDAPGQDDEEGEGEEEGLDDDLAGFLPPRQPSRGENRQQRLANENRELRRQLDDMRRVPPAPQAPGQGTQSYGETDQQFEARVALLNPDERMEARMQRFTAQADMRERVRTQQTQQEMDRTAFNMKANSDSRYKRWADRVEVEFNKHLAQGMFVPREVVFRFLLGDHLLSREGQAETRRTAARGKQRVERQTTRPVNTGSDVGRGRGRETEAQARARRLESQQI